MSAAGSRARPPLCVTHVSFHLDPEGRDPETLLRVWPTLTDVAVAAAGDGVHIEVVQRAASDAVIDVDGVRFHFVGAPSTRTARLPGATRVPALPGVLRRAVEHCRPDVLHVRGMAFPFRTRALCRAFPHVPVLVQDNGSRPLHGWRRRVHGRGFARIAAAAFTARAQAEPFIAADMLPASLPIHEVPESSSRFTPGDVAAARAELGFTGDPCLLWVGRLIESKDPFTVLEAVARAAETLPDARLYLCYGAAPLLDTVRARIAEDARLSDRVTLLGKVPHARVETALRATDFLLSASRIEGSGYAIIEALACGATPLVTDIPSFRALTGGGRIGALTPAGDASAMARALVELARRDRTSLRAAARAHFERELSFAAVGARLRAIYRMLAAAA